MEAVVLPAICKSCATVRQSTGDLRPETRENASPREQRNAISRVAPSFKDFWAFVCTDFSDLEVTASDPTEGSWLEKSNIASSFMVDLERRCQVIAAADVR